MSKVHKIPTIGDDTFSWTMHPDAPRISKEECLEKLRELGVSEEEIQAGLNKIELENLREEDDDYDI